MNKMIDLISINTIDKIFEDSDDLQPISKWIYVEFLTKHFKNLDTTIENSMMFEIEINSINNFSKLEPHFKNLNDYGIITLTKNSIVFNNKWGQFIKKSELKSEQSSNFSLEFDFGNDESIKPVASEPTIELDKCIDEKDKISIVENKDWKDIIYENSKEAQGFFAELEFELAEPKNQKAQVEELNDLPWEKEEELNTQEQPKSIFKYHEHAEFCFLEVFEYQEDIMEFCKQQALIYIKHKYPNSEIIEVIVQYEATESGILIKYIQCVDKYKIKFTVRMQNIYQSIIELYEL